MSDIQVLPELKQIIGALVFGAKTPVTLAEIKRVLKQVAEGEGGPYKDFGEVADDDIAAAIDALKRDMESAKLGVHVAEVANGLRMQNDGSCGIWLRYLLDKGRGNRLTKPALETLAIIAYRQPCSRAEIEAVRGVAVDQIVRNLMDLQLIKILGRSELPGRPWLFGTTQKFLEYFGLKNVNDLPGVEELRRMEAEQQKKNSAVQDEMALEPAQVETDQAEAPSAQEQEQEPQQDEEDDAMPGPKKTSEEDEQDELDREEEKDEKEEQDEEDEDEYDDEDDEDEEEEEEDDGDEDEDDR
jgi:segregation and condensation protein B